MEQTKMPGYIDEPIDRDYPPPVRREISRTTCHKSAKQPAPRFHDVAYNRHCCPHRSLVREAQAK